MSLSSQSYSYRKRKNPYSSSGRPSAKRFKPRAPTIKRRNVKKMFRNPSNETYYNTGAFVTTDLPTVSGEDSAQQPWRLISASTFNTGNQAARDQQLINAYPFGTAPFSRLGRKITLKNLQMHLKIQSFSQRDVTVRYVLVQKYDVDNKSDEDQTIEDNNPFSLRGTDMLNAAWNDAPPSAYNTNNPIMSMRDLNGTLKFRILLDKKVTIRQNWNNNYPVPQTSWGINTQIDPHPYGECDVTQGIPQSQVYKDHYIDLGNLVTTYSFTGDSTVTQNYQYVETNGLYLIAATDYISTTTSGQPDPLPRISGSWRMSYLP